MADQECTLTGVTVMKHNRLGLVLSLLFSLACLLAMTFVLARFGAPHGKDGGAFIRVMVYGILGGGAGAWWFSRMSVKPSALVGELRATPNGIYVQGKRLVARRAIQSAYVRPDPDGTAFVRIERRGPLALPLDLTVKSVAEGRALLHALGLDATQSVQDFAITAPSRAHYRRRLYTLWVGLPLLVVSAILAGMALHGPAVGVVVLGAVAGYGALVLQLMKTATLEVGADGVDIRWLWQRRFIPIGDIVRAEVVEGETNGWGYYPMLVRLHMRSGEPVDLLAQLGRGMSGGFGRRFVRMRADIAAERINEAVLGGGKGQASALAAGHAALLSRGERAVGEWVAALRGLREKIPTFREAGASLDELWTVLEDAAAPAEQRAAAAVALSPHLDDGGRQRLRVAAEATVAPRLRVALEAAAADDDERLVSALEDCTAAEPRPAARA